MILLPFCIIDLIMKFAGAYSQDPYKSIYLEDIKLMKVTDDNLPEYVKVNKDLYTHMIV